MTPRCADLDALRGFAMLLGIAPPLVIAVASFGREAVGRLEVAVTALPAASWLADGGPREFHAANGARQ